MMPSVQEMIYDIWKCLIVDSNSGEKFLRVGPEEQPKPPVPPEPEEPDPEDESME